MNGISQVAIIVALRGVPLEPDFLIWKTPAMGKTEMTLSALELRSIGRGYSPGPDWIWSWPI